MWLYSHEEKGYLLVSLVASHLSSSEGVLMVNSQDQRRQRHQGGCKSPFKDLVLHPSAKISFFLEIVLQIFGLPVIPSTGTLVIGTSTHLQGNDN